ncbi:MAG: methyltransferase domain-containing protein [Bacteroidota bacterium]
MNMRKPEWYRKGIPFYEKKTEADYRKDPYEHYDDMVIRQVALHLADELWGAYPMQAVLDFAKPHCRVAPNDCILEIGCGVGRWIGHLAQAHPSAQCWGIDYSYQMLQQANRFWRQGETLDLDYRHKGFSKKLNKAGHRLQNLQLGLAKASHLPFEDHSQDWVLSSFLLDRLDDPIKGLLEMYRVLKPQGQVIAISPLNFAKATHWDKYYPPNQFAQVLKQLGFELLHWQEDILIKEPIDFHGNAVIWNCLGMVLGKD